jgi:CheY-like chemotaxis protein
MSCVLVVEDDQAIQSLVVDVLTHDGYQADGASDGLIALEKVRQSTPDLLVLDLFMPRMDGYEFLNVTRTLANAASTPVCCAVGGRSAAQRSAHQGRTQETLRP